MSTMLIHKQGKIEKAQLEILREFNRELNGDMLSNHDPLDDLLTLDLDSVLDLIKEAYEIYLDENWSPKVAKIKALEDYSLWYYGNPEKEILLREKISDL